MRPVAEFFIIGERFVVITRQLQAAEVRSKLSTVNDKSTFVKVPLVITKQLVIIKKLKLYFKGIVSPDWKGLQMVSLDRFEV
jgi:hypothetical protein